jgi:hypothetical protein
MVEFMEQSNFTSELICLRMARMSLCLAQGSRK